MNNCFFCTSLCIRSLEDHLFTRSHDCSMRRRDRTEEPFFLELKSLHFFIRPCLSHIHLLRSCSTRKLSDFGLARDCPKGETSYVITRVMGTFGYAAPQSGCSQILEKVGLINNV